MPYNNYGGQTMWGRGGLGELDEMGFKSPGGARPGKRKMGGGVTEGVKHL